MDFFKALRRSIKGDKESKPHISIAPKSAVAIVPPKKVRLAPTLAGWVHEPRSTGPDPSVPPSPHLFRPPALTGEN